MKELPDKNKKKSINSTRFTIIIKNMKLNAVDVVKSANDKMTTAAYTRKFSSARNTLLDIMSHISRTKSTDEIINILQLTNSKNAVMMKSSIDKTKKMIRK